MKPFFLIILILITTNLVKAESKLFTLCPLCDQAGEITCPNGYEADCLNANTEMSIPKCIFFNNMYVPGCWQFVGIQKLDLNFDTKMFPPSWMAKVTGGGETYTLNIETVGCKSRDLLQ